MSPGPPFAREGGGPGNLRPPTPIFGPGSPGSPPLAPQARESIGRGLLGRVSVVNQDLREWRVGKISRHSALIPALPCFSQKWQLTAWQGQMHATRNAYPRTPPNPPTHGPQRCGCTRSPSLVICLKVRRRGTRHTLCPLVSRLALPLLWHFLTVTAQSL